MHIVRVLFARIEQGAAHERSQLTAQTDDKADFAILIVFPTITAPICLQVSITDSSAPGMTRP
jgi:hypothetical protein